MQSLFLLYPQFHGSQRTKQLEIFEFSRADSNTFPLLYITVGKVKWFMEKNCLRQLDVLINSFNFYWKRFLKKPLYRALWPKRRFFKWNCLPPVGQKSEIGPKIFPRLFILGLAPSIAKVSTRSYKGTPPTLKSRFYSNPA